jgi:hypothetical protein
VSRIRDAAVACSEPSRSFVSGSGTPGAPVGDVATSNRQIHILVLVLLISIATWACGSSRGEEGAECIASCSGGLLGGCNYSCHDSLFCDERPWPHICRRRPSAHEACELPPPDQFITSRVLPCESGLFCRDDGTCAQLMTEGQACTRADQPQCASPLWCVRVEVGGGGRTCLPAGGSGQRCRFGIEKIMSTATTCDANLECVLDPSCIEPRSCASDRCLAR